MHYRHPEKLASAAFMDCRHLWYYKALWNLPVIMSWNFSGNAVVEFTGNTIDIFNLLFPDIQSG
ncbi:MAG: hypothetical protein EA364_16340 [Balneolaceae bacterium]|nr:MAG: hypothetical protein EA364_16340 [Balneolaceae bacterium]